jgi:hypothetical protein
MKNKTSITTSLMVKIQLFSSIPPLSIKLSKCTFIIIFLLGLNPIFAQQFQIADPANIALFPQQNDFRNILNLSGIGQFKKDSSI